MKTREEIALFMMPVVYMETERMDPYQMADHAFELADAFIKVRDSKVDPSANKAKEPKREQRKVITWGYNG